MNQMCVRVLAVCLLVVSLAPPVAAQAPAAGPERFAAEIKAFADWDAKNATPANAVLFVGSSTIRLWPTAERFPDLPVVNRGFGGSQIFEVTHYIQEVALKYAADVIVFYAGDNDINAGKMPERVLADYQTFVTRVHAAKPTTRIIFLAIKPSLARWKIWPEMRRANDLVKAYSARTPNLIYADMAAPTLGADGQPRPDFFIADGLHLNAAGYDAWTRALAPVIAAARKR